jgi:hypothetical protein
MADLRVNTDVMRNSAGTVSSNGDKIGQTVNKISGLNSQVPNTYDGQLREKVGPILAQAVGDGTRLQGQSGQFSANLNSLAGQIDDVMQQGDAALSKVLEVTASRSPVTEFFSRVGQIGTGAITFLLGLAGFKTRKDIVTRLGPEAVKTPDPIQTSTSSPPAENSPSTKSGRLGSLSEKYESGGNPGRVSSGIGDIGGVSYGAYQLTSAGGGSVAAFLNSKAGNPWASEFAGLVPGTKEFSAKWQEIAQREPEKFLEAQHDYIQLTHYDPLVEKVARVGLDVNTRSEALKNVIWSTGVQHGAHTDVVETALNGRDPATMSDEEIIRAIYAERGRKSPDGTLVRFRSSSPAVQQGVAKRFERELNDALAMLRNE